MRERTRVGRRNSKRQGSDELRAILYGRGREDAASGGGGRADLDHSGRSTVEDALGRPRPSEASATPRGSHATLGVVVGTLL